MFQSKNFKELIDFKGDEKVTDLLILTYSLNLRMLNDIIVRSGIISQYTLENTPENLMSHISCIVQKNRGAGEFTRQKNNLYAYLALISGSIKTISYNEKSFHPKLWGFLYTKGEEKRVRLIISSRNVTSQNMLEGVICLDEKVGTKEIEANKALVDLLRIDLTEEEQLNKKNNDNKTCRGKFIEAVNSTNFIQNIQKICDNEAVTYKFLTPQCYLIDELKRSYTCAKDFVAVSPFLSCKTVSEFIKDKDNYFIITRKCEYTTEFKNNKIELHYLKKNPDVVQEDMQLDESYDFNEDEKPLHAKIYAFDCESGSDLYIGSSNFSENGFNNNYELMVKITSKNVKFAEILQKYFKKKACFIENPSDNKNEDERINLDIPKIEVNEDNIKNTINMIKSQKKEDELWKFFDTIFADENQIKKYNDCPLDYAMRVVVNREDSSAISTEKINAYPDNKDIKQYKAELLEGIGGIDNGV